MEYKISVIMPVYNAARFLKEAMDSLIGQTIGFENLQVIMVDDCSTDESPKMLAEYAERYSNVEIYKTEVNSGAAGTPRNIGLEHVKAPYIMFLDPDDFYDLDACQILYKTIIETDVEIVGGYYYTVDKNGDNSHRWGLVNEERHLTCPEQMIDALKIGGGFSNKLYNAEFINGHWIRFAKEGYGEDTAFTCKCLVKACKYVYVPYSIMFYRQNDASAIHVISEQYFAKNLSSMQSIRETLEPFPKAKCWKMGALSEFYFRQSLLAQNLDRDALIRIYKNYSELFSVIRENASIEYPYALKLISSGQYELAADYTLTAREYEYRIQRLEEMIGRQENRIITRMADAVNQRRFGDVLKICIEALRKKLKC